MPNEVAKLMKERNMSEIDAYRSYLKTLRMFANRSR